MMVKAIIQEGGEVRLQVKPEVEGLKRWSLVLVHPGGREEVADGVKAESPRWMRIAVDVINAAELEDVERARKLATLLSNNRKRTEAEMRRRARLLLAYLSQEPLFGG